MRFKLKKKKLSVGYRLKSKQKELKMTKETEKSHNSTVHGHMYLCKANDQ